MKLLTFALPLLFCLTSHANTLEREAASQPLLDYLQAHATGNPDYIRRAFAADAMITGHMEGKLVSLNLEQFAQRFSGKPPIDEDKRIRRFEILDLSPDAGVARVELDYPKVKFIDYMSLLKINGVWKIVHKSYHSQSKVPASN